MLLVVMAAAALAASGPHSVVAKQSVPARSHRIPDAGILDRDDLIQIIRNYTVATANADQFSDLPGGEFVGREFSTVIEPTLSETSYDRDAQTLRIRVYGLYCLPIQTKVTYKGMESGQTAMGVKSRYSSGSAETLGIGWGIPAYSITFELPLSGDEARSLSGNYKVKLAGVLRKGRGLGQQENQLVSAIADQKKATLDSKYEARQIFRWVNVTPTRVELIDGRTGDVVLHKEIDESNYDIKVK